MQVNFHKFDRDSWKHSALGIHVVKSCGIDSLYFLCKFIRHSWLKEKRTINRQTSRKAQQRMWLRSRSKASLEPSGMWFPFLCINQTWALSTASLFFCITVTKPSFWIENFQDCEWGASVFHHYGSCNCFFIPWLQESSDTHRLDE